MLQTQLQVTLVPSGGCSGGSSMGLLSHTVRLHPPWDPAAGKVSWGVIPAILWPGRASAEHSVFGALTWDQSQLANTSLHGRFLPLASVQSKWWLAGDGWKEATISWWLVLGGSGWVTLLHFMVVLHLRVPAVSEIAWAGAALYQFCSQQALQVKHFIAGIRLCSLLDSLR